MTREESVLCVTLALAPFERVMPAAVGVFRARHGYSILEDADARDVEIWYRLGREETQRNVLHVNLGVISEPEDAPGVTLIEDWMGPDREALGHVLPDVGFLSLVSLVEDARTEQHGFRWRIGPDEVRRVDAHRGMERSGWDWEESGRVQPFEEPERYRERAVSKRCDRGLLFDYAARHGVDLQAALGERRLKRSLLVREISDWDATPGLTPTTVGESYRKAAVMAGFGTGEEDRPFAEQAAEAAFVQTVDAAYEGHRKAVRRARSVKGKLAALEAIGPAPGDGFEQVYFVSLWRETLHEVVYKFPDAPLLPEFVARAVERTGDLDHGITLAEASLAAPKAKGAKAGHDVVREYRAALKAARTLPDVWEALSPYLDRVDSKEFETQFSINMAWEFFERGAKIDAGHRGLPGLAEFHDRLQVEAGQASDWRDGDAHRRLRELKKRAGEA